MSNLKDIATRELVRDILEHPECRDWTLQGLGMLRTYLTEELRLHVWDKHFAVPGVSELHTHPWALDSLVVAGALRNVRYRPTGKVNGMPYMRQRLKCGAGACLEGEPELAFLRAMEVEYYAAGECYHQEAYEIHQSFPENGTVTLVQRTFNGDRDHALVFWPYEMGWVTAEPRPATEMEVQAITSNALQRWFS